MLECSNDTLHVRIFHIRKEISKVKRLKISRANQAWLYLLPWVVGMLVLQIIPFATSFWYSLTDYNPISREANFIGLANYIQLFTRDHEFFTSLRATVLFTLLTVPARIIFSLIIALLLNKGRRGIGILRTVYYLPSLFGGSVAVAVLWRLMFMDQGIINGLLNGIGLSSIPFLGDPRFALPTLSSLEVWQFGS